MSLATKDLYFLFHGTFYKQIHGLAMDSLLGLTLGKAFIAYQEKSWLEQWQLKYRPFCDRRYDDEKFVSFKSSEYLKHFQNYLNFCHANIPFAIENEKDNMSFLDTSIVSVYCKPSFSGIHSHFESFLPRTYKIGMIHTFLYRCSRIYLDWTKLSFGS